MGKKIGKKWQYINTKNGEKMGKNGEKWEKMGKNGKKLIQKMAIGNRWTIINKKIKNRDKLKIMRVKIKLKWLDNI